MVNCNSSIATYSIATKSIATESQLQQLTLRFEVLITSKVENLQLGVDVLQLCCNWTTKCCNSKGGRFVVITRRVFATPAAMRVVADHAGGIARRVFATPTALE